MSKRSSSRNTRNTNAGRVTIGGITGVVVVAILLIAQYALGIDVLNTEEEAPPPPVVDAPADPSVGLVAIPGGYDGGWFQLYFTDPLNTQDESRFIGAPIEDALVAAIDAAQQRIDVAVFEMTSQPVTDALLRAHERGVQIRVVTDGDHGLERPDTTLDQLDAVGIPIVSDGSRGAYMHNKFFVIDRLYIWTGSTNITTNGFYNNNNNALLIRSSQLARNYEDEFEELFAGQFGPTSPGTIRHTDVTISGTRIETFFESEGNASNQRDFPARLAELLDEAHTVRFLANVLTRDDLMQPMIARAQAGELDVMGVVESVQRRFTMPMFCAGMQVRQDGNPNIMHHKVFILDDEIVVTGSFNFSAGAADSNDENILIIHNRDIAQAYLEEFQRRWSEASPVPDSALTC